MTDFIDGSDEDLVRSKLEAMRLGDFDLHILVKDSEHARKIRLMIYRDFNNKFPPRRKYRTSIREDEPDYYLSVFRMG